MKVFTGIPLEFQRAARRGQVRYDWRRHRYIATCERCQKIVVIEDQHGNDVRNEQEYNEIGSGQDRVRGRHLFYPRHTKTVTRGNRAIRCDLSEQAIGSTPEPPRE
jgi:hypothetical protein